MNESIRDRFRRKVRAAASVARQKVVMGLAFLFLMLALAMMDLFAFGYGATATISQGWLTANRRCWILTYVLVFWTGVLQQHVSVPRNPGQPDDPTFLVFARQVALWTPVWWLGCYVAYLRLSQLPNVD
jgi:hypothetical protein